MNMEHKEKLLSGVETWNNWRKKHYWFAQIDLSETRFRGDVSGIDASKQAPRRSQLISLASSKLASLSCEQ